MAASTTTEKSKIYVFAVTEGSGQVLRVFLSSKSAQQFKAEQEQRGVDIAASVLRRLWVQTVELRP